MTTLGRRRKCLRNRSEQGHVRALRADQMRNRPLPGAPGNTVDQTRLKPCRPRPFGLHRELDRRVKKEIPAHTLCCGRVHSELLILGVDVAKSTARLGLR
jgi:hypothetical protein